ncbi:MAG TPA: SDR family oxidoreductase [Candidatus Limnocylindrales bacterium]|nr:SDR family oxidoreductase [Candidatus Limnocylindrales bacterium]
MTLDSQPTTHPLAGSPVERGLAGRVVLVTGAASGLGAAISRVLASAGMRVVVADLELRRSAEVADAIGADGGEALAAALDVRDAASAESAVRAALDGFGRLDVLVNNAGTDVTKPFEEMTADEFDRVIDVNLRGPAVMTRAALPALRASQAPHVVNVASTAAKRTWPNASAYHASKWGLLGLSHALHAELRPDGIKVTAVVAGGMRTPFILDRFPEVDPGVLQDPANVAATVRFVLELPAETVIPEVTVLPMRETSWP